MECYEPVEGRFIYAAARFVRAHPLEVDSTRSPGHGRAVTQNGVFVWSRLSVNFRS
jgi:hypothetical protein